MPKVSVVIPIYGVEKYIERCAIHLFEQTLEDMEFIFVNDCTQDNSIAVLQAVIEKYPMRSNQIHIIHHEVNKGLSRARQTGVSVATGEYIAHCDSDDSVNREMYEQLYAVAIENNSDVVKCGHKIISNNKIVKINSVIPNEENITTEKALSLLLLHNGWNSIWDTIVKRELYHNCPIQFTDIAMCEDMVVMAQILSNARKINIVQQPLYNYYMNPNSICGSSKESDHIRRAKQAVQNLNWIFKYINLNWGNRFSDEIVAAKSIPRNILINVMDKKKNYAYWKQIFPEIKWSVYSSHYVTWEQKIRLMLVELYLYPFYAKLKAFLRK